MNLVESLLPSGDLDQRPYARALVALTIGFVLSHMLTMPVVTAQIGILPFVVTQLALLWWWFALVVKRLRNAERSILGVTAVALIDFIAVVLLAVMLVLQFSDPTASVAGPYLPASLSFLVYPFVFLANVTTGPAANPQDLQVAFLALFALAPLLLTIWYSVWAALQPAELHVTE